MEAPANRDVAVDDFREDNTLKGEVHSSQILFCDMPKKSEVSDYFVSLQNLTFKKLTDPPASAGDVVSTFPLLRAAIFATITMPIVTYNLIFPFLIHCF